MDFSGLEDRKKTLKQFALEVNREINIRRGDFAARTQVEKKWYIEGPVQPHLLATVLRYQRMASLAGDI